MFCMVFSTLLGILHEVISITCAAAAVRGEFVTRVAGAVVAAQGVDTALLTVPVIRPGAFVYLCIRSKPQGQKVTKVGKAVSMQFRSITFKEISCEPSFVHRTVRYKFHPQLVGAAFDIVWLFIATETAQ